jgi:hypothetical protein
MVTVEMAMTIARLWCSADELSCVFIDIYVSVGVRACLKCEPMFEITEIKVKFSEAYINIMKT